MHMHALPRFLLVAFTTAFIAASLLAAPVKADTTTWSDTLSNENVVVHACKEFDITTSYTTNRTFKLVTNSIDDQVVERMYVSFVGALANDTTGQSLPYDGKFTRISDYQRNIVTIRDFELRFQPASSEHLTIAFKERASDLLGEPPAVLRAIWQPRLDSELCAWLGGTSGRQPSISLNVHTENTALPQPVNVYTENSALAEQPNEADDDMTPWTEFDSCDTSPPGQGC